MRFMNVSVARPEHWPDTSDEKENWDDSIWIITSSFIIFTMQSGFGMLESGLVQAKNEVNIMVKNFLDVICGGLFYWAFGFGIAFGDLEGYANPFCGFGGFFLDADEERMGHTFSWFVFQLSFATTACTIVSGSMAERSRLSSYMVISVICVFIHAFPAHWIWSDRGFLSRLGCIDIAGASAVHLVGGCIGLVATIMLKPRHNRFPSGNHRWSCPTNALLGTFMLWWGWLGFNCGSSFGVTNGKWKLAARSAVSTLLASMAGGLTSLILSQGFFKRLKVDLLLNGILSSLVSITSLCAIARPWQSILIGVIGSALATGTVPLLERFQIDDPVGVIPTHFVGGIWGLLSVGFFANTDNILDFSKGKAGLLSGGGVYIMGVQMLAVLVVSAWSIGLAYIFLKIVQLSPLGLRLSLEEELLGSDFVEHGLLHNRADYDSETVENYLKTATANARKILRVRSKRDHS